MIIIVEFVAYLDRQISSMHEVRATLPVNWGEVRERLGEGSSESSGCSRQTQCHGAALLFTVHV